MCKCSTNCMPCVVYIHTIHGPRAYTSGARAPASQSPPMQRRQSKARELPWEGGRPGGRLLAALCEYLQSAAPLDGVGDSSDRTWLVASACACVALLRVRAGILDYRRPPLCTCGHPVSLYVLKQEITVAAYGCV